MRNRSWIKNLLRGKRANRPANGRPGDELFLVPRVRCLEDRRVLAVDTVVAGAEVSGAVEGSVVSLSGAMFTDSTGDGNQPHTAEIDWGDGNVSQAIVTAPTDSAPGIVEGEHTYQDNGSYTVSVTVTGADLLSLGDTTTFNILNDPPSNVALQLSAPTVDENGSVTLEGTFDDAGTLDEHTIEIDWGDDNPPEQFVIPVGERTFSATHQYLNDGPSNAPSDIYQISATVTDDDGDFGTGDTSITVNNIAPSNVVIDLTPTTIDENGQVSLQGTFDDPGTLDEHTIEIDWGDGSPLEQFVIPVGDRGFSATHTYLDDGPKGSDTHLVSVTATVIDSDGGWASGTADVTINNVAPSNLVLAVSPGTVDEPGLVTLQGSFDDPGTQDAFTVQIDWGDGESDTLYLAPGETTFEIQHTYEDDKPSGTAYDLYTISVTVGDDDTGSITETAVVQVNNLPPTDHTLSLSAASVDENGSVTLDGEFLQPGLLDTHTVEINWGDGSANTLLVLAAGETTFSASHTYADDDPSGTAFDTYSINVTVTDDDTGVATASTTVDVVNVPPSSLSLILSSPTIDENGTVMLSGSFSDDGSLDEHTVEIDWGDGSPLQVETLAVGERTFSFSHTYLDDAPSGTPADNYSIAVTVKDDDLGQTSASASVEVQNVAPQMVSLALDDLVIDENGVAWLNGVFLDPGTLDEYELEIDWGDGSPPTTVALGVGERNFRLSHQYLDDTPTATPFDDYTIDVTLTDDDGGVATDSVIATVKNVAPQITSLTITPVLEDEMATLTGTYSDTGTLDTHFVDIDWDGDGLFDETNLAVSGGTFSFTHLYADDDPTGNPSDTFNVTLRLHDDDTGTDQKVASQTVTNVAPVLTNIVGDTINENGVATVSATISDPGTQDVFTVTVDWQDGTPADTITGLGLVDAAGTIGGTGYTWTAATRELVLTHQYQDDGPSPGNGTASDIYTVALTVADDDLGTSKATATVVVNNVVPSLINVIGDTIDEHGVATITAVVSDPGTQDAFSVTVDWQDGTPPATISGLGLVDATGTVGSTGYTWIAATRELTLTHQYLDDGTFPGNGTASDSYTVTLNVADDDLGSSDTTATVVVNNVAPNLINIVGDTIDENAVATVTAIISDPGTKDVFSVTVDWQDGTPADTITGLGLADASGMVGGTNYTWIAATRELTLTHQYLDDGTFPGNGTASDVYSVMLDVSDDDLGTSDTTATVVVNNVAPTLINIVGDTIDEHGAATVTAVVNDPGTQDVFSVTVDWQDGTPADTITGLGLVDVAGTIGGTGYTWTAGTRELVLTHQYLDDGPYPGNGTASDSYTVTLNVADDDLGSSNATATVVVNNVAPNLINIVGDTIDENAVAAVTAIISDPGTQDVFSVTVDWQDGTPADTITGLGLVDTSGTMGGTGYTWVAATRELTLTHQYLDDGPYPGNSTASDTYTVTLNVADDDLGTSDATATVVVNNVAPNLINIVGDTIDENAVATVTAVIDDPGTKDVFSVTVDWQDGTAADTITGLGLTDATGTVGGTNYTWIAVTRELTLTHQYLDDGPYPGNGSASDAYTVTLNVSDDDLGANDSTASVVVNNVAPSLIDIVGDTIDEHGVATISAVISDAGTKDVFSVTVDWQDSTAADTITGLGLIDATGTVGGTGYTWTAATRELLLTHQYLDDGPYPGNATASDIYNVTLNVADDDLGASDTTATVIVNNVAPTLIEIVGDTIDEHGLATLTAVISDPGTKDLFSVTVDWQDGTPADTISGLGLIDASGTVGSTNYTWVAATRDLTLTHQYLDDGTFPGNGTASDIYTVTLNVADDDLGTSDATATVVVNNVAPILINVVSDTIDENGVATITAVINDPSTKDVFSVTVDWQDGTPADSITGLGLVDATGTVGGTGYTWIATTRELTLTHQYLDDGTFPGNGTASDIYTVTLNVADDDLGTSDTTATVVVNNVAPNLINIVGDTIDEHGVATVTAVISDPGTKDVFSVTVDWQDGTAADTITGLGLVDATGTVGGTGYTWIAATRELTLTHQYLDDGAYPGNGTASDIYTVTLNVADDDLGTSNSTATVVVNNVAPNLINVVGSSIDEHDLATVAAVVSDPGTKDVFSVTIDWQDGTAADMITGLGLTDAAGTVGSTNYVWIAATRELTLTHQYLDDGPYPGNGTASDTYTVTLNVADDDLGTSDTTATVVVNNVAPQLINIVGDEIDEDSVATVTAIISDPGTQDIFSVTVNWQDGTPTDTIANLGLVDAAGTVGGTAYTWNAVTRELTLSHQYLDDGTFPGNGTPSDTYTVALTVSDDDLGLTSATTTVVVNNVIPSQIIFTATPDVINEMQSVTITGTFIDTGRQDQHTLMVDWGDGTPPEAITTFTSVNGMGTFTATHQYLDDNPTGSPTDTNTIRVFVTDDDAGTGVGSAPITVNNIAPVINMISATQLNNTGSTTVTLTFSDVGVQDTYTIIIDWADGTAPQQVPLPTGSTSLVISHQYLAPPDPANPAEDIPILVTVQDDDLQSAAQLVLADVPGQHVFGVALNVPLQTEPIDFQVVSNVAATPIVVPPPLSNVRTFTDQRAGGDLVQGADRRVIVRTVSIEGEEANEAVLPETTLDDLPALFRRLPDGRYRIYLRQDKLERLILDVNVRQGKSVDPADENDGTRDRPPTSQVDPDKSPEPISQAHTNDQPTLSDNATQPSLDLNEVDWSKAARLLRELRRRLPT